MVKYFWSLFRNVLFTNLGWSGSLPTYISHRNNIILLIANPIRSQMSWLLLTMYKPPILMSAETYYKATNQISLSFHRSWHTIILSLLSEFFSSNLAKGCSCKWPFGAPFTVWHAMQMQRGFSPWSWSSSLPTIRVEDFSGDVTFINAVYVYKTLYKSNC